MIIHLKKIDKFPDSIPSKTKSQLKKDPLSLSLSLYNLLSHSTHVESPHDRLNRDFRTNEIFSEIRDRMHNNSSGTKCGNIESNNQPSVLPYSPYPPPSPLFIEETRWIRNAAQTRGVSKYIPTDARGLIDFLTNCINNADGVPARGVCTGWPQENEHGQVRRMNHGYAYKY